MPKTQSLELPVLERPCLVGRSMIRASIEGRRPLLRKDLPQGWCVRWSTEMSECGQCEPSSALGVVAVHLAELGSHSHQSLDRLAGDMSLFVARLEVIGVRDLREVTRQHVIEFIDEALRIDRYVFRDPSLGTRHFRRTAVRVFFKTARALGLCEHDPTMDIDLPPRSTRSARPLTDEEVLAGEAASHHTLDATRLPAAWALGEATAVSSEMGAACIGDVDLEHGRVWLRGCSNRTPRWGSLTDWGARAVDRRIRQLDTDDSATGLVYGGGATGKSPQSSSCGAVHEVLVLAGLNREPDVRPLSLAAWAGGREFERSGRIEDVANLLGFSTLDRAARAIGWEWRR